MDRYDVVVVGGGAAGLNGALMLARSRRRVVVVDAGAPRNAPAHAVHGLLGHDGTPPGELLAAGRAEVVRYGGEVLEGEVVAARGEVDRFEVDLADGRTLPARRLLVTTGLTDELPDVTGLARHWGGAVVHCPYCHGYEVRDRAVGVLATSPMATHQALLFSQLSDDVVLLAHTAPPGEEDAALLAGAGVRVVPGEVLAVEGTADEITGVRLADGGVVAREVLAVQTRMHARGDLLAGVGLPLEPHPSGLGEHVPSGPAGTTAVPGVWVAGNVTDLTAQVGASAAAGALAGAHANADLVLADARAAAPGL